MRDIIIKNVKDAGFERKNLKQFYDPKDNKPREEVFWGNKMSASYPC